MPEQRKRPDYRWRRQIGGRSHRRRCVSDLSLQGRAF